jgi:membrane protein required for colicin V production
MVWVDYVIVAIVAVSAVISLFRGFLREALSLAGWVIGIWLAVTFVDVAAVPLEPYVSVPSLRQAAAFFSIFLASLLVTGLVVWLAGQLVKRTGLSGTDRVLGMIFGIARGGLVVVLLVLLAGLTSMPRDPWWQEAIILPHFQQIALDLREFLPAEVAEQIGY